MSEIPKLQPEVEIPRPRSSGIAVVAVAALAMFTAVGASAFVVRMRMSNRPCAAHYAKLRRAAAPPIVEARRLELRDVFLAAAARGDDETALEIYRGIPRGYDPSGELERVYDIVVGRQVDALERDLARGDCDALKTRLAWLKRVVPDERIDVRTGECRRSRIVEVELVNR